ncbi:MAG TPA: hypothetical protein VF178_00515 [Gemmatimonadaceae bacterium]
MLRKIGGVVAGLVAWLITVTALGEIMRASWPAYASAAPTMAFTLPMLISRLAIGAVATVAAGLVSASVGSRSPFWISLPGILLLAAFIPVHIGLWANFPVWYHLTFLLSLVPLTYLGGRIRHPHVFQPIGPQ